MFISKIVINNYRNFRNFECKLKQFTLVIGENNIGKTNLINAISMIISPEFSGNRYRQLSIEDINYSAVQSFKEETLKALKDEINPNDVELPNVLISITLEDFTSDQKAVVFNWFVDDKYEQATLTYVFYPSQVHLSSLKWFTTLKERMSKEDTLSAEMIDFPIDTYRYMIFGGKDKDKVFDSYSLNLLRMEFLDAMRDARKELVWQNEYRLLNKVLASRLSNKTLSNELLRNICNLNDSIKNDPMVEGLINEIKEKLENISYGEDNQSVDYAFKDINNKDIFKRLCIQYGIEPVSVERNGLGRNNLLFIALVLSQLEYREGYENQPYFRLISIEEPEAHLHPHIQKHLAYRLEKQLCENFETSSCNKGEGCGLTCKMRQIIVTSHSTHITSHLGLYNTMILFKNDGVVNNHYILKGLDVIKHKQSIHFLSKFLDATNATLFYARRIILVEGIAEEILIPLFYQMIYKRTLESNGITLINVRGVAFKHFLEIIKNGYFVKCVVFTDSDLPDDFSTNVAKLKNDYEENSNGVISISVSNQTTFEKDIIDSNRTDQYQETVLSALKACHYKLTCEYEKVHKGDLDIEKCFKIIYCKDKGRNSKSDFAFELYNVICSNASVEFSIPSYIKNGFEFING
jgi:predicted ATP-dependent endonuclease of OLD family